MLRASEVNSQWYTFQKEGRVDSQLWVAPEWRIHPTDGWVFGLVSYPAGVPGVVKDLWIDCVAAAGNRSSLSGLWAGIFEFVG